MKKLLRETIPPASTVPTDKLMEEAARRAIAYLEALADRPVAPLPKGMSKLVQLDQPLPEAPSDPLTTLKFMDETCRDATMAMAGPRFFGFVIGGTLPVALAANWIAGAWDQNSAYYKSTPSTAYLEQVALCWLQELFHLDPETQGAFVTGATMSNFTCLAAARHAVLKKTGWNVEADGLFGAPPITVVVGEEAHPSLIKSLGLLGLGRSRVVKVPTDEQGRMRADRLPKLSGPSIVCAQAGNVNTGAFDPFSEICDWAHAADAWVHVDGAFGLWALAAPSRAYLAEAVAAAASMGGCQTAPFDAAYLEVGRKLFSGAREGWLAHVGPARTLFIKTFPDNPNWVEAWKEKALLHNKLLLLAAPAGYGKTSLVVEWLAGQTGGAPLEHQRRPAGSKRKTDRLDLALPESGTGRYAAGSETSLGIR